MNSQSQHKIHCGALMLLMLTVFPLPSRAFSLGITVKGEVISPPCTINDGKSITIDFGYGVLAESIDGTNYEVSIPYSIKCPYGASTLLKLQLSGTGAAFDASLLQTSKNNLAIQIKTNGTQFDINHWQNITYQTQPALSAVLIRNGMGRITLGSFTSAATLMVEYQ